MKVASYNIAQSSQNTYYSATATTKTFQMKKMLMSDDNINYLEENTDEEEETSDIAEHAKHQLIESLMAYLDKRPFDYTEIPTVEPSSDTQDTDGTGALCVKFNDDDNARYIMATTITKSFYEMETLEFKSSGHIIAEDGRIFDYSYDTKMHREFFQKNMSAVQGSFLDPLVLNLDNKGVNFSDKKIHIDLDLDGEIDTFNMLGNGSGYLVLDKNNNGKVDDGSELFGPRTNDGFKELSAYDEDGNQWIDENDLIFDNLKIWMLDENGMETLVDIKDTDIGAIHLNKTDGTFDYKDDKKVTARITGTSIFLKEDGSVHSIHEILV